MSNNWIILLISEVFGALYGTSYYLWFSDLGGTSQPPTPRLHPKVENIPSDNRSNQLSSKSIFINIHPLSQTLGRSASLLCEGGPVANNKGRRLFYLSSAIISMWGNFTRKQSRKYLGMCDYNTCFMERSISLAHSLMVQVRDFHERKCSGEAGSGCREVH